MSAKKEKEKRSLLRALEKIGDQNKGLYEVGYDWFDDEDAHEQWFSEACFVLMIAPEVESDLLIPTRLPFLMEEMGLAEESDIAIMLEDISPAKLEKIIHEIEVKS